MEDRGNWDKKRGVTKAMQGRLMPKDTELFRNVSVYEFYLLKALIILEQVNTSVVEKKKTKKFRW